jgi:hypothetical protein
MLTGPKDEEEEEEEEEEHHTVRTITIRSHSTHMCEQYIKSRFFPPRKALKKGVGVGNTASS